MPSTIFLVSMHIPTVAARQAKKNSIESPAQTRDAPKSERPTGALSIKASTMPPTVPPSAVPTIAPKPAQSEIIPDQSDAYTASSIEKAATRSHLVLAVEVHVEGVLVVVVGGVGQQHGHDHIVDLRADRSDALLELLLQHVQQIADGIGMGSLTLHILDESFQGVVSLLVDGLGLVEEDGFRSGSCHLLGVDLHRCLVATEQTQVGGTLAAVGGIVVVDLIGQGIGGIAAAVDGAVAAEAVVHLFRQLADVVADLSGNVAQVLGTQVLGEVVAGGVHRSGVNLTAGGTLGLGQTLLPGFPDLSFKLVVVSGPLGSFALAADGALGPVVGHKADDVLIGIAQGAGADAAEAVTAVHTGCGHFLDDIVFHGEGVLLHGTDVLLIQRMSRLLDVLTHVDHGAVFGILAVQQEAEVKGQQAQLLLFVGAGHGKVNAQVSVALQVGIDIKEAGALHHEGENKNTDFSCMNCHSFGNRDANNMLFHVRSTDYAGTYIWIDGKMEKLNTKTPQTISALVYPSWHPSNKYIAFSVNDTKQTFYTGNPDKIEVFDYKSDVVVYDVEKHEMVTAPQLFSKAQFETFPTFSPDGKRLFFCSADSTQMPHNLDKVRYALCAIDFNPETREFGNKVDTIYKDIQKSATLPRVSPDGKYLLFTVGNYGNFHIWHKSSNLWLHDFATGKNTIARRWTSNDVESYHSWSSNSRWVVFSSRRDEGLHTRLYIGYIDENGEMGRPFLLPQEDPSHNNRLMKSYNIPEFVKGKIDEKGYEVRNADKGIDLKFATDIPTDMTSGASVKN